MIAVTRLDKQLMYLNPDHIICIEETPDTVITLFNGNRYIVTDHASTIISRVVAFRARISRRASRPTGKRYLGRPPAHRFDWTAAHEASEPLTDSSGRHSHIPLHGRDY